MEAPSALSDQVLKIKLQHVFKELPPPKTKTSEWGKYQSAVDQFSALVDFQNDLHQLQQLFLESNANSSNSCPAQQIEDWFHYCYQLLCCHEFLMTSPLFKRFKVNRYEMLDRLEEWLKQYQQLSQISGIPSHHRIVAWPAFIEQFHIRKLFKYLAGYWVQWQGFSPSNARKIMSLFGFSTKACSRDLYNIELPWPPGFEPKSIDPKPVR